MAFENNQNINNKNTQDIFFRNAWISLLDLFNKNVTIDLYRDDKLEKHKVPFFPNMANDEGFMKDFFVNMPDDCKIPQYAEGNYEPLPRGVITLKSWTVKSANITNKFVRGTYHQQETGDSGEKVNKAYSARLYSLPMMLKFDVEILSDNVNKSLRIAEEVMDTYYKNNVMYFQYKGMRIPAQFVYPDDIQQDKEYKLTYETDQRVKNVFSVEMETYFPSFNDESTMYKGNVIRQWFINQKNKDSGTPLNSAFIDEDAPPSE